MRIALRRAILRTRDFDVTVTVIDVGTCRPTRRRRRRRAVGSWRRESIAARQPRETDRTFTRAAATTERRDDKGRRHSRDYRGMALGAANLCTSTHGRATCRVPLGPLARDTFDFHARPTRNCF